MVQPRISRPWWPAEEETGNVVVHGVEASAPSPLSGFASEAIPSVGRSRIERNAVKAAAHKVATVTLASTIGIFGSSQIAFAAGLSADLSEQPVIEAPGNALANTPIAAGSSSAPTGAASGNASASPSTPSPSEPDAIDGDSSKSPQNPDVEASNGMTSSETGAMGEGFSAAPSGTALSLGAEGVDEDSIDLETMALAEASFADRVNEALAASSNAVVALSENETLDAQIAIPAGKQLTIDLNGHTLSCSGGTPFFMDGFGSTFTVIDSSASKTGVLNTGGATLLAQDSLEKANFNLLSGHITCSNLGNTGFVQFTLSGGSVSMSTRMVISDPTRVDIQGTCSVTSSASNGAFRVNSSVVSVSSTARVSYTGSGAIFDLNGGSVILGSGATASGNITATNGDIVLFEKKSSSATINNPDIVCNANHAVFTATGTGTQAKITFISGTVPDSSMKEFLSPGSFVFHVPGGGFIVHDQAFINDECVGICNGVYYYSEDDFAKATGDKTAFKLVEFTFDKASLAGSSLSGKVERVHVMPNTKLADVPLFKLDSAPAKEGYTFYWVRSSTGAKYTQSEVLSLPIAASAQPYSFVGKYEANAVTPPPGPIDPNPGPGPEPGPGPVDPVDPVDPNPVDPIDPNGPGSDDNTTPPNKNTEDNGSSSRAPRGASPARPWLPANLALAAGFTVPESGPGVVVLNELGQPVIAAAESGAGDGDPEGSLYQADDSDGGRISFTAGEAVRTLAVVGGVALAALLVARVGSFMAANAAASRARRRKSLGLE